MKLGLNALRKGVGQLFERHGVNGARSTAPDLGPRAQRVGAGGGDAQGRPPSRAGAGVAASRPPRGPSAQTSPPVPSGSRPAADTAQRGVEFLKLFRLDEVDGLSGTQMRRVAVHLGQQGSTIPADAPLAQNWATLRTAFNPGELMHLIRTRPEQVASFLAQPSVKADASARAPEGASPSQRVDTLLRQHPVEAIDRYGQAQLAQVVESLAGLPGGLGVDTDLVANWKTLRAEFHRPGETEALMRQQPREVARFLVNGPGSAQPQASPPAPPSPIKLAEASRGQVRTMLAERGLSAAQMKQLRADVHEFINHGNDASRQALTVKYAAVLSDDLSDSRVFARLARNLRDV